jgi:hypothetical protein
MKAVLDLPASLLRKARAEARRRGVPIEKLAARGFRLALAEETPTPRRRKKPTAAEMEAWLAKERAITEEFRIPRIDKRPVAEVVSSMRR